MSRAITSRDLIGTWFVADAPSDASKFPQTGSDSSKKSFQDIYWKCIVCFFATASRYVGHASLVLYTNVRQLPLIDGVDITDFLLKINVQVRYLEIEHRLGSDKTSSWGNQFYILDIIKDLNDRKDFDTVTILDSDCIWVNSPESLLIDIERRQILSLAIPYGIDFVNNGASRRDLRNASGALLDVELNFVPHYSGGEIFAATNAGLKQVWELAKPMWDRLSTASPGQIKVFEEGQFLSILYEAADVPLGTADAHCKRMWTSLRMYSVTNQDIYSSLCIWHLPMEKRVGFQSLYKAVTVENSWFWSTDKSILFIKLAKIMGLPKRNFRQWMKHVVERFNFHCERRALMVKNVIRTMTHSAGAVKRTEDSL